MLVYKGFFVGSESAAEALPTPGMAAERRINSWNKACFFTSVSYRARGRAILTVRRFDGRNPGSTLCRRGLCCPGESLRRAAYEEAQCGRWNANSISPRRDHQFLQWSQVSGPPPVVGQGVDRAWHLWLPLLRTRGSESSPVQETD